MNTRYAYVVSFTNAEGGVTERGFDTEKEVRGYILALAEQDIDFKITKHLGKAFTDWANATLNEGMFKA